MRSKSELEEIWQNVKPMLFSAACSLLSQELENGEIDNPLQLNQVGIEKLIQALPVLRTATDSKFNAQEREWMLLFEAWLRVRRAFLSRRTTTVVPSGNQLFAVV